MVRGTKMEREVIKPVQENINCRIWVVGLWEVTVTCSQLFCVFGNF